MWYQNYCGWGPFRATFVFTHQYRREYFGPKIQTLEISSKIIPLFHMELKKYGKIWKDVTRVLYVWASAILLGLWKCLSVQLNKLENVLKMWHGYYTCLGQIDTSYIIIYYLSLQLCLLSLWVLGSWGIRSVYVQTVLPIRGFMLVMNCLCFDTWLFYRLWLENWI